MTRRTGRTWVETRVEELFDLSEGERVVVEFRAALARALQTARRRKKLSLRQAAIVLGTSLSHVSRMEAGASSVSLDRMLRGLAALGLSRADIVKALGGAA